MPPVTQDSKPTPPVDERCGSGPIGTYGCACVTRDARNCALLRYGYTDNCGSFDERCECLCHQWEDEQP
jgi:hypothetical protein